MINYALFFLEITTTEPAATRTTAAIIIHVDVSTPVEGEVPVPEPEDTVAKIAIGDKSSLTTVTCFFARSYELSFKISHSDAAML